MKAYNKSIFNSLKGSWNLDRTVSSFGKFVGTAQFIPIQEDLLHYKEEGRFLSQDQNLQFYREYFYEYTDSNINVYFSQNGKKDRYFHKLDFTKDNTTNEKYVAEDDHLCINDLYKSHYEFLSENEFSIYFDVKGPQKDYNIKTVFKRRSSL